MRHPLIGITTGYNQGSEPEASLAQRYIHAVQRAGGAPVVLVPIDDEGLLERYAYSLDGLIISGGRDIPPHLYGEEPHPYTDALPEERPLFEMQLVRLFRKQDKPVLGICYGCQLLNVSQGGTLIQHIPDEAEGALSHHPRTRHTVCIQPGSLLHNILRQDEVEIVSSHHQAVKSVGRGLRVVSQAPDGVIEAIELEEARFVLGVQWHPELDPDAPATLQLMGAFCRAALERDNI